MEVPAAVLAVLFFTETLCCASLSMDTPTTCCFFYISRRIPRKFVDDYYETSSQCAKPAVIFQTKRGRQVCADPSDAWVQEYIAHLELNA